LANSDNNNGNRNNDGERVKAFVARAQSQTGTGSGGGDNNGVRGFVARAESSIAEAGSENRGDNRDNRGGRNNRHGGNFGRGPVRKNNPGGQGQNRGPRDVRENRDRPGAVPGAPRPEGQPADNQSKNLPRHGKPERGPKPGRENFEGILNRRPARGAKEETLEDIRKDIAAIEKEIELEISDISVMKLNV
jgi:hypothetical protein